MTYTWALALFSSADGCSRNATCSNSLRLRRHDLFSQLLHIPGASVAVDIYRTQFYNEELSLFKTNEDNSTGTCGVHRGSVYDFAGIISVLDSVRVFHILLAASILISICGTIKSIIDGEKSARVLLVGILALGLSDCSILYVFLRYVPAAADQHRFRQACSFSSVLMINAALRIKQLYKQIETSRKNGDKL